MRFRSPTLGGEREVAANEISFTAAGPSSDQRSADAQSVLASLRSAGYDVSDLRNNELAKSHLRHLGGGRAGVPNERLIRFEFPERPGALSHFLDSLNAVGWNVSLFQYRNHGADIGRVLAGLQVPSDQMDRMSSFLDEVGYRYHLEHDNEMATQFL